MEKIDFVNSTHPALNDENLNRMQDNIERAINAQVSGDTLPIGALLPFSGERIPENWLLCNGQEVSREKYNQLFAVIGTTYGKGDGSTTFKLPNMMGRVPVGRSNTDFEFYLLGQAGGEKNHTLTINEMPSHSHTAINYAYGYSGGSQYGLFTLIAGTETEGTPKAVKETGESKPHNNLQPYLTQNYIIKAFQSSGIVANIENNFSNSETNAYSCKYINTSTKSTDTNGWTKIVYSNGVTKYFQKKSFTREIEAGGWGYGVFSPLPVGLSTTENAIVTASCFSSDPAVSVSVGDNNSEIKYTFQNKYSSSVNPTLKISVVIELI